MFCPNCGSKNEDNVKFCAHCGSIIINDKESEKSYDNDYSININNSKYSNNNKYIFTDGRYINCRNIIEVKREGNSILIMTSKSIYYIKYKNENEALNDYTKFISFIVDDVFEFRNYN